MTIYLRHFLRIVGALLICAMLAACDGEPAVDQTALPILTAGEPYRASLSATGGHQPYRWSVADGQLPQGLKLDSATGLVEGTATQLGRYDLAVTVRDAADRATLAVVRLDVIEADAPLVPREHSKTDPIEAAPKAALASLSTLAASSASLTGLVNLLTAMPEGSWVQASLNNYADVWTPEELRPLDVNGGGASPPSKIIIAWSGFAWDSARGDLLLYGGGHANYPGNDVYRWRGSTRSWERASLPSEITKDASGNFTAIDGPDNAPAAAHTYDNNIYLPIADRFLTFGGAAYNNGGAYRRATSGGQSRNTGPYLWDPSKADANKVGGTTGSHVKRVSPHPEIVGGQMWQNRDFVLNLAGNPSLPAGHVEGCTGYAQENGKDVVYAVARLGFGTASQLFKYIVNDVNNPKLDSWTQVGGYWDAPQGQTVCTYDPGQKIVVRLGNKTVPFTLWDVTAPGGNSNYEKPIVYTESSGEFAAKLASAQIDIRYCGLDFDPARRQYALWCGGPDVWMLKPPASVNPAGWTLQKQTAIAGGAAPTSATGTGILGKWKYIPNLDAFMALQDSTAGNIWIYKPVGWQAPAGGGGGGGGGTANQPPTVSLTSPTNGQQFAVGQVLTLQANAADADGTVAAVDFYDGATRLAHVTASPWRFDWAGAALGSHTLSAVAFDNLQASQASGAVTIQIAQASVGGSVVLQDGLGGYSGTRDSYFDSSAKNANFGTATSLLDFYTYNAMVVRFAIFNREGGPVPDNALISSATLELYKSTFYSQTLSAYRLKCDWQESQTTWTVCRTGVPWAVGAALGVDTDYVSLADGAATAAWEPGWVKLDVSAGLKAMQAGAPNYGWRLKRTAGDDINVKRYFSREYAGMVSFRPKLTVSYSVP